MNASESEIQRLSGEQGRLMGKLIAIHTQAWAKTLIEKWARGGGVLMRLLTFAAPRKSLAREDIERIRMSELSHRWPASVSVPRLCAQVRLRPPNYLAAAALAAEAERRVLKPCANMAISRGRITSCWN